MNAIDLNLQTVINASGKMSAIGVSILSDEVVEAMKQGAQSFYVMDDLKHEAGRQIARYMKTEAAMITNSASSAIVMAISGLLTKDNMHLVHNINAQSQICQNEVIIMTGHNIDYGAPIETMIQLAGAQVKFVGYANGCTLRQIEDSVSDQTLAMIYVQSHHCVQKNMPKLADVSQLMQKHAIPLIVDAAAETDISAFNTLADMCILSGSKAISGPTSGILAGKQSYIEYATYHEKGIGRAMKIGKESILGLLKALQLYSLSTGSENDHHALLQRLQTVEALPGVTAAIVSEEGRDISRLRITIDPSLAYMDALAIVNKLRQGDIAIYTRDYYANQGFFEVDPRALNDDDVTIIYNKLKLIVEG